MGVLAEGVMFFLPAWAMTLPVLRRMLASAVLVLLVVPFAFTNSLRMASITSADVAMARADRQTGGIEGPQSDLDKNKAAPSQAFGKGPGKTVGCPTRPSGMAKPEGKQNHATAKRAPQGQT